MKYTNIIKKEIKIMLVVVVILLLVVLGVSYALFMQVKNNTNNQVITTGTLQIEYSSNNGYINGETYNELVPMSNDQGLLQSGYEFSVKNTGTLPVTYQVCIYVNYAGFNEDKAAGVIDGEIFEELNLIKYNLQTNNDGNKNINKITEQKKYHENEILKYVLTEEKLEDENDVNNHKIKIWLDEDIDIENVGKYIYLKLEVTSYITGQEPKACKLTNDENSNGTADIGDIITCDTEIFNVYNNDGETIKMLSKYNLYVGGEYDTTTSTYIAYGEEATGLQDSNMLGGSSSITVAKGVTQFANDEIKGTNYADYEGSLVQEYVNAYNDKLTKIGVKPKEVTLISKEELDNLHGSILEQGSLDSWAPEWLDSTSYWTKTYYDENAIWGIVPDSGLAGSPYNSYLCIRPVVYISVDEI